MIRHFTPESKAERMEWKYQSSTIRNKFKITPSAYKLPLAIYWDAKSVLQLDVFKCGGSIKIEEGNSK